MRAAVALEPQPVARSCARRRATSPLQTRMRAARSAPRTSWRQLRRTLRRRSTAGRRGAVLVPRMRRQGMPSRRAAAGRASLVEPSDRRRLRARSSPRGQSAASDDQPWRRCEPVARGEAYPDRASSLKAGLHSTLVRPRLATRVDAIADDPLLGERVAKVALRVPFSGVDEVARTARRADQLALPRDHARQARRAAGCCSPRRRRPRRAPLEDLVLGAAGCEAVLAERVASG